MSMLKKNEQKESEIKNYKVYMHINKINSKKYIGITKQKPKERWQNGYGYIGCTVFYNAIKKYRWDSFEHKILIDNLSKEEACETEIKLIKQYKTTDRNFGYNISLGGDGVNIPIRNTEWKSRISQSHMGELNPSARKIVLINKKYELIKVYNCIKYAADELGLHITKIQGVCDKKASNTGGYIFMYYTEYMENKKELLQKEPIQLKPYKRKILQYDLEHNFIKEYESIREAARQTNISRYSIGDNLVGKLKTGGGYLWEYAS